MDLPNIPHLLSNRSEPKNNRDRRRSRARQEKTQHSSKNKSINFDNKESIERAVAGEPKAKDVVSEKDSAEHPFAAK